MKREYTKWFSQALGREMEMLVFGQDGVPVMVFPTSLGRFYEFEDRGMVGMVAEKIERRRLQLFCVDSVDGESLFNWSVGPRERILRHMQYERYVMDEAVPFARTNRERPQLAAVGCGHGGYHALNFSLKHPGTFGTCVSMSGAFDLKKRGCLDGYYDENWYFNLPLDYLPNLNDAALLDSMQHNNYVLASGGKDEWWSDNEQMAAVMKAKGIPVRLDVWGDHAWRDWPWWQKMVQSYL